MSEILRKTIGDRTAWKGSDLERSDEWVYQLRSETLEESDAAASEARRRGLDVLDFSKPSWGSKEFPIPSFEPLVEPILDQLENGLGFLLIRGVDATSHDVGHLASIFWGLHSYLGESVPQSIKGDHLGHVRDEGGDSIVKGHNRGYKSTKATAFHSDDCDIVSLFCLRAAQKGGLSGVASAAQIHNDILKDHPDLLEVLYQPFYVDWQGEEPAGWKPYFTCPVFSYFAGRLSIRGGVSKIYSAQEKYRDVPRLTDKQKAALDVLQRAASDNQIEFALEPGDIFTVNNYAVVHSRTAYEDFGPVGERRHLMRLWLTPPNARPLADDFSERYGSSTAGVPRGLYRNG